MLFQNFLKFCVLLLSFGSISADEEFDINDILNDDFMPASLLMIDKDTPLDSNEFGQNVTYDNSSLTATNGSFDDAFSTMKFHRKMMNEYLCRNFLADQILEEMTPTSFNRRIGTRPAPFSAAAKAISSTTPKPARSRKARVSAASVVKDNLLTDEGSSNYKDWLSKTTTLEDIYRHYNPNNKIDSGDDFETDDSPREDFDSDITGFAVQGVVKPHSPIKIPVLSSANVAKVGSSGGGHSGYGYSPSAGSYQPPVPYGGSAHGQEYVHQHYEVPQFVHYHHGGGGGSKKEMILKDLFEIALTALAFLSFGVFAIQVILCIAATHHTTTTSATFLSMIDGGTGTGTGTGGGTEPTSEDTGPAIIIANDAINPPNSGGIYSGSTNYDHYSSNYREEESRRKRQRNKRAATTIDNSLVNEVARRVLVSMEAVFFAHKDNGNCLRREICANNKYSRSVNNNQKLWIPVYGLALSWLSGRVTPNMASAPAMLESLKAAALGLGNADCDLVYSNCDLNKPHDDRRRKRRKRFAENSTSNDFE